MTCSLANFVPVEIRTAALPADKMKWPFSYLLDIQAFLLAYIQANEIPIIQILRELALNMYVSLIQEIRAISSVCPATRRPQRICGASPGNHEQPSIQKKSGA